MPYRTEDNQEPNPDRARYLSRRGPCNPKLRPLPVWAKRPIPEVWRKVLADASETDHLVVPDDGDYLI